MGEMVTYGEALALIQGWYAYGDRDICVTWPVFCAYRSGQQTLTRQTDTIPAPDKFGRTFMAYKTARVYSLGGQR